jgi:hypothetical protein
LHRVQSYVRDRGARKTRIVVGRLAAAGSARSSSLRDSSLLSGGLGIVCGDKCHRAFERASAGVHVVVVERRRLVDGDEMGVLAALCSPPGTPVVAAAAAPTGQR